MDFQKTAFILMTSQVVRRTICPVDRKEWAVRSTHFTEKLLRYSYACALACFAGKESPLKHNSFFDAIYLYKYNQLGKSSEKCQLTNSSVEGT